MLLAGMLVLGLGGCGCRQEPAGLLPAADAGKGATPEAVPSSAKDGPERAPQTRWPTDFQCPLDVHIEVPKVPDKIRAASPSVRSEKK